MPRKLEHLQLILDVDIDPQGVPLEDLKRRVSQVVKDAVNNGTLTGDTPATVEHYYYEVNHISPPGEGIVAKAPLPYRDPSRKIVKIKPKN